MAKPLVERKSTVTAQKKKRRKVPKGPDDKFEVVSDGGNVRRIYFDGVESEPAPAPAPAPAPKAAPAKAEEVEFMEDFQPVRAPAPRRTNMQGIHSEIDHLLRIESPASVRSHENETVTRYTSTLSESRRYDGSAIDALLARVHFTDDEPEPEPVAAPAPAKPAKKPAKKAAKKPVAKPAKKAAKKPAKKALPRDYKGDVHYVVDLEGIGPVYEQKLHAANIYNTQELLFTGDRRLANVTGAPAKVIQNWKNMSQLVKIKGIGPQFAELMVRAGIGGIEELKTLDPAKALAQIKTYEAGLDSRVTGSGIGLKRLTAWQATAKPMRKVAIDLKKIEVIDLESRQAISSVSDGEKKKPSRSKAAQVPTKEFPTELLAKAAKKPAAKKPAKKAPAKKPAAKKPAPKAAAKPAAKPKAAAKAATCAAKTAAGSNCKRPARDRSKYCATHKGYRA